MSTIFIIVCVRTKIKTEGSLNDHQEVMNQNNPDKVAVPCTEDSDRQVDADQLDHTASPLRNLPDSDRVAVSCRPTKGSGSKIVSMLEERMNVPEYKNWMKLGFALNLLYQIVVPIAERTLEAFQENLRNKHGVCHTSNCKLGKQPETCEVCSRWMEDITKQHFNPGEIFSSAINPKKWSEDKWEVAKMYMPKRHKDGKHDLSSILNLMLKCKKFHTDTQKTPSIKAAIEARNELAHCITKISDDNLQKNLDKILNMLDKLHADEDVKTIVRKLKTMDLKTIVAGLQSSSSTLTQNTMNLQDLEKNFLSEQFTELDGDQLSSQDKEHRAKILHDFLSKNQDLMKDFEDQFKKIEILFEGLAQSKTYLEAQSISVECGNVACENTCGVTINASEAQSISGEYGNVVSDITTCNMPINARDCCSTQ